ncbi:TPA: isochorismatase family protein, partial [Escherichia coli]|nr:isochorismatase family protein [Escherichia coli]
DIEIIKRQWGAFYGTDLELQLRRRGIDTIVLPRFYVSTSKSIIKALINMHSFEIQLSPIG